MSSRSSKLTPFQRFESEYLACWEAAREAQARLTCATAQLVLRQMGIALLQHFERFCVDQHSEIARLRPKLAGAKVSTSERVTGDRINSVFSKLIGGDVLSKSELMRLNRIAREAGAALPLRGRSEQDLDGTARLDAIFDLAVKIARSTGAAAGRGLSPAIKNQRTVAARAARLLRARYDSLA